MYFYIFLIGCIILFTKSDRLFYILLSLEFIIIDLFFCFSNFLGEQLFFYFMCFCVILSTLGLVVLCGSLKYFGSDMCCY